MKLNIFENMPKSPQGNNPFVFNKKISFASAGFILGYSSLSNAIDMLTSTRLYYVINGTLSRKILPILTNNFSERGKLADGLALRPAGSHRAGKLSPSVIGVNTKAVSLAGHQKRRQRRL